MRRGQGWIRADLSPPRLDRAELHRRLTEASAWVIDEMADIYEAAALAAMAERQAASKSSTGAGA